MPRPSTPRSMSNRNSGFTLIELLLAVTLAVVVVGLAMAFVFSSRNVFTLDRARTNANQNLRSGLDIMMADVRQAGERIGRDLPAVEVVKGTTDTLSLRRNLLDAVLPVCVDISTGSASAVQFAGGDGSNPDCKTLTDAGTVTAFDAWSEYLGSHNGTIHGFIYDPGGTNDHEFFAIDAITESSMQISRDGGKWANSYSAASKPRIYLLEERTYSLDAATHTLQLSVNGGAAQNVVADVTAFDVEAYKRPISSPVLSSGDGAFSGTGWQQDLAYIKVSLTAQDNSRREVLERTLADQATPRNVLSSSGGS